MKVFFLILFVYCSASILPVNAYTDYPGYTRIADIALFKKEFTALSAKLNRIESDFMQEKTLSALTESITSQGRMWFKRENRIRMDYTSPFVYKMIIRNDKMMIYDGQRESRVNVNSNKLFQQVNRIMIDCMQGTILDSKDFTLRAFENSKSYLLELTPVSKTLKEFFQTIVLIVEKKDGSPVSIGLNEPSGDKTLITLTNKAINGILPDEVFSF